MSRHTEKAFKAVREFLAQNATEDMSMDEVNEMLGNFMEQYNSNIPEDVTEATAKTADDFVELALTAQEEDDIPEALRFARKALKIDPDNLDAELIVAVYGGAKYYDAVKRLERAAAKGTKIMEKKGYMNDSVGDFWGVLETRPYMRLRTEYAKTLLEFGMYRKAIAEFEELIRLCDNDNIGNRYTLMHLYAFMEMEEEALALHEKYENSDEAQMLMPLAMLYYKTGDRDKAEKYLKRIAKSNKDLIKFVKAFNNDELHRYADQMDHMGYRPYSIEELITEMTENSTFFRLMWTFFDWAEDLLKKK